jgi:hypothetical protein
MNIEATSLINTGLQPGEGTRSEHSNRFNGLRAGEETVETVSCPSTAQFTPLKRGVNESRTFRLSAVFLLSAAKERKEHKDLSLTPTLKI